MRIEAALTYKSFRFDQDTDAHLVLTITAPEKIGEAQRPPICIVPVIDNSGSMNGDKMEYAKLSCRKLIEHLRPGDYCGLITFESNVVVHVPPQKVTPESRAKILAAIQKIQPMGSTNFSGGMLEALRLVEALDLPSEVLCRVIMFTDGQANVGIATKPPEILKLLSNAGRTSVSAFGYGSDADQEFLSTLSEQGKGNYAYISEPDGALSAFGKELGGLLSTVSTNLVIGVTANSAHQVTAVITDVPHEIEPVGGETTIRVSDIYAEEVRHLVLAVKVKEQKTTLPRPVNAFDVRMDYDLIDDQGKCTRSSLEAKAKAQFVKAGEEQKTPDEHLKRVVDLAELVGSR
jgi:Ca-activated chloride channel family protein